MDCVAKNAERKLVVHLIPHQRASINVLERMLVPPVRVRPTGLVVDEAVASLVLRDRRQPPNRDPQNLDPILDPETDPHGQFIHLQDAEAHAPRSHLPEVTRVLKELEQFLSRDRDCLLTL